MNFNYDAEHGDIPLSDLLSYDFYEKDADNNFARKYMLEFFKQNMKENPEPMIKILEFRDCMFQIELKIMKPLLSQ